MRKHSNQTELWLMYVICIINRVTHWWVTQVWVRDGFHVMYESEACAQPPYWLTLFLGVKYTRARSPPPVLEAAELQKVYLDKVREYLRPEGRTYQFKPPVSGGTCWQVLTMAACYSHSENVVLLSADSQVYSLFNRLVNLSTQQRNTLQENNYSIR